MRWQLIVVAVNLAFAHARFVEILQIPEETTSIDPEVYMNATELITSKGYPCENHWAITEDGYILNLVRIPHGRNASHKVKESRPAIFIQHGILTSATNFLTNLANQSLAYLLADAGADVWLGNSRGNIYSRNHTSLDPDKIEFWQFSWDQMARYDVPANVDYIRRVTGQDQIFYAGHSQGTAMAFAGFSENATLASHIKQFIALAPVARVAHIESPIKLLAPFLKEFGFFEAVFGHGAFVFPQFLKDELATALCPKAERLCENLIFLLCGFDHKMFNTSRLPVYIAHNPAGASSHDIMQWGQNYVAKQFQKFDFGSAKKNMEHYGQSTPPIYDPSKSKVPVAMFTGGQDWLGDPKDVAWLLPQLNVSHHINVDYYNHLDFLWAMDAPQKIYSEIIKIVMS